MSIILVSILENFLGEPRKHNEDTSQIAFDCPACSEEKGMIEGDGKGNLEINYNLGIYKCWSCQETNNMHGPVVKLLKRYGSEKNLRDYILFKPDTDLTKAKEHNIVVELPEGYKKLSECTDRDFKYRLALNYLRDRGITDEIIKEFDIGYTYRGKFFNRIIIPSYDIEGKLNYFIARWFSKEKNKLKYLNPVAEKQEIIFNEGKINLDATIYIVEGVTDHIVTPNSIPLLGKYISPKLLELLHDKAMGYIVIVLDDDAKLDSLLLYKQLNFGNLRDRIKICFPPNGHDPSSIFQILGSSGIVKLLKSARVPTGYELNYLS
jgi:DNA primase